MTDRRDKMPLGHDGYLKLWAMSEPELSFEYILLDEAQDTNPVVLDVLMKQPAQLVYVGDKHQQIYEWRGAINAMEQITGLQESYLTQSFRFGQAIADAASLVLRTLGEVRNIQGNRSCRAQSLLLALLVPFFVASMRLSSRKFSTR
jgi:superfamily I DNA/RNA helicase